MFDVIGGFVGLGFAWLMLGIALFPVATFVEFLSSKYLSYSTDGDVKIPKMFRRGWNKIDNIIDDKFRRGDAEFIVGGGALVYVVTFAISLVNSYGEHKRYARGNDDYDVQLIDVLQYGLFDFWVPLGAWMSPVLIVVGGVLGITYLSRKSFKFKKVLVKHMADKKVHKNG